MRIHYLLTISCLCGYLLLLYVSAIDFKDDDDIKKHFIVPNKFEEVLNEIAQDGVIRYEWRGLKKLIRWKICLVSLFCCRYLLFLSLI